MTEAEWLVCKDFAGLLGWLQPSVSERKLRLFAVGCGRIALPEFRQDRNEAERVLCVAERFAEGLATQAEMSQECDNRRKLRDACAHVVRVTCVTSTWGRPTPAFNAAYHAAHHALGYAPVAWVKRNPGHRQQSKGAQAAKALVVEELLFVLRDIFGNPFRPFFFIPSWRTETVVALASAIYAERAFDRMPILADALEEAGCDHADVLSHCRGPGPHVRGCWVVDGVLGKE